MGHPLEKQFFLAFLCLSMATTISATRKEDLERAAELAVERAAERAAERAVEKALEAGNTTSTTITVKESYSNARKTAEEQAAPGSESTRQKNKETSIFETKETDDPPDYESSLNGTDHSDSNESRDYSDEESSGYGDYNDSRGYSDHNDSRGYSDHNDSRGYSDHNDSRNFREFEDSKSLGDHNDSRGFDDLNESQKYKGYSEPRGFGNQNFGSGGYSDSKNLRDPRRYNQSKNYNHSGDSNYTRSEEYRSSHNNSQGYRDPKSLNHYGDSKGYEVEEDYSSFLNHTDYKKLNSSKSPMKPKAKLPFGDFDWSSNDSNLRHGFGSKLLGFGKKLTTSALSEDLSLYSTETDFSRKRNTKKEDEEEDGADKDDTWKSYSDWKKDFTSYSDETFPKDDETFTKDDETFPKDDEPFLKGYDEPFTKDFWGSDTKDSPHKSSRPFWADKDYISSSETKKEDKTEYGSNKNPQEKGETLSSTHQYSKHPFSIDYDFTTFTKSWQPENKDSRPSYKSYNRRSTKDGNSAREIIPPYHKRLSRDNAQDRGTTSTPVKITQTTVRPTARTTERTFRVDNNRLKETSNERYSYRSEEGYKEGSYEGSEDKSDEQTEKRFRNESREEYKEKFKESEEESEEESKEGSDEKYKNTSKERRTKGLTQTSNIRYVLNRKEENVSDEVKTIPYKLKALNVYRQTPNDVKESRQPHTTYKVPKTIPVPVPVSSSFPGHLPNPVQHQENIQEVKEDQENLRGNDQENIQGSSHVQFLQNFYDSPNMPLVHLFIPRRNSKVPKPIVKQVLDSHEVPKFYSGQKRLPILKEHQQVAVDDRLPMLVKLAVPGPFPIENDNLQLEKPYSVPVKVHVENPYAIHLDESIPLALKERIPFTIHVPLKPKENDGWSEAKHSKKYENVPTESQTWIKRLSLLRN